jgi:adenylate cyclase
VRRPGILRRLIDGSPDASGKAIVRRAAALDAAAAIASNVIGAMVVVVLAVWVLPHPSVEDRDEVVLVNLVTASIYLVAAIALGTAWGLTRLRRSHAWLIEEREPDDDERRRALRLPLAHMRMIGLLWLAAVVVFTVLNARYSGILALTVGVTVFLGGATTCAISYLLIERFTRPAAARALATGAPDRPVLPGVMTRAMLAWLLGGGVPMLGLILLAIFDLGGRHIDADQLALTMLSLSVVSLLLGVGVTWQAARSTADPVMSVRGALHEVEGGNFDAEVPVYDGSEMGLLQAGFNRMAHGLREREEIRDLFGRQVGADVAREAIDRGVELGGEEVEVAVLFVDVIGSTKLAAEREPTEVVERLNEFFSVVVEVVESHEGSVNKFEGDAVLAIFGAPVPIDDAAGSALAAGREMAKRIADEVSDLDAGIGVSAGRAVAGNVGAESRFEYTVIGDPVNEAARLCDVAKDEDARVVASAAAVERAGDEEAERWSLGDEVELRGRGEPTRTATPQVEAGAGG